MGFQQAVNDQAYAKLGFLGLQGSGKALRNDEPVLTIEGFKPICEVKAGDSVLDGEGHGTTVESVYPQGELETFRVEFADGTSIVCCGDHLWKVQKARSGQDWHVLSTSEIRTFMDEDHGDQRFRVPLFNPRNLNDLVDTKTITAIVPDGRAECTCIRVASPERTFITRDYTVTHNTFSAAEVAVGLHKILTEKELCDPKQPIYMVDTETGASWIRGKFESQGIPFQVDKTRAFTDLVADCKMVAKENGILIIDSITHFWTELCTAYAKKNKRKRMSMQDWGNIKEIWRDFTDEYVNGASHLIMCGRQGYEYDFFKDDDGKQQLQKTAVKMKAEGETGYEPSLLIVMERHQILNESGSIDDVYRTAYILKDRADVIDGKVFKNPSFKDFLPHIEKLNLGGEHVGVDTSRTSENAVRIETSESYRLDQQRREIVLEEVTELLKKHYPSQSSIDKATRMDLIEEFFRTRSWKKVETMDLNELRSAHNAMFKKLEGKPLYPDMPLPGEDQTLGTKDADIPF